MTSEPAPESPRAVGAAGSSRLAVTAAVVVALVVAVGAVVMVIRSGAGDTPAGSDDGVDDPAAQGGPTPVPDDPGVRAPDGCTGSTERICVRWPHSFVETNTGEPIAGNGVNVQDAVESAWHYPVERIVQPGSPQFDLVRVALNWPVFEPAAGQFDAGAFAQLDQFVAEARAAGLHVVLDPIHLRRQRSAYWELHPGSTWNMPGWAWEAAGIPVAEVDDLELEQLYDCNADVVLAGSALGYLEEIVRRYADEPAVIAVDLVNEPRNSCWGMEGQPGSGPEAAQELLDLQLGWVDHLRTIDPDKVFVIEPMYGDIDPGVLDLGGFTTRPNLVWSLHDYYSGVGAAYEESGVAAGERAARYDLDELGREERQAAMGTMVAHVVDTLAAVGVPVFVGEYGYVASSPHFEEGLVDKRDLYDTDPANGRETSLARAYWVMNYDQWGFELFVDADKAWVDGASVLTHGETR